MSKKLPQDQEHAVKMLGEALGRSLVRNRKYKKPASKIAGAAAVAILEHILNRPQISGTGKDQRGEYIPFEELKK